MGTASKVHRGISSSKKGTAFNSHRKEVHHSPRSNEGRSSDFPAFPKPAGEAGSDRSGGNTGVSKPSGVRPGVVYADDKPAPSNEKPSDSSFFDATRPSEKDDPRKPDTENKPSFEEDESTDDDRSEFDRFHPHSQDKPSFDEDKSTDDARSEFDRFHPHSHDKPSFDEDKSTDDDPSEFDRFNPDSDDKPSPDSDSSFDENKSSDDDRSRFESTKPDSKDEEPFDSDESAEWREPGFGSEKPSLSDDRPAGGRADFGKEKREFSGRSGVKPPFPGTPKFPGSSDKPFLAGTPKIKFVMGPEARGRYSARGPLKSGPLRKRPFRDGPSAFHSLRDRVFYLSGAGDVPAYGYPSVYGPSAALLYDAGGAHLLAEDVFLL